MVTQLVNNPSAMKETLDQFLGQKYPWRRGRLPTPVFMDFPGGSHGKASVYNAGDLDREDSLEKEMATHSSTLA